MHYYKRNIGDYAKKAGRLSMLEHGAYTLLIDSCYDRERFPTRSDAIAWLCAKSDDEVRAIEYILSNFFTLEGEFYVQKRIQEEIENFRKKSLKNKEIAINREVARKESKTRTSTKRAPNEQDRAPNHKPLIIKPISNNSDELLDSPVRKRGTRLEENWTAPEEYLEYCRKTRPELDAQLVAIEFRNYWSALSTQNACKRNWFSTWQNWVIKHRGFPMQTRQQQAENWLNSVTGQHRNDIIDI